jgi:cyclophilin family peptidyl-prolyl cis-trans isomerase/HEAT repeat protein
MSRMTARRALLVALLVPLACASPTPPPPASLPASGIAVEGFTIEEEARILAIEDRREFDAGVAASWLANPNPLHRARMALALGRIGPHTFVDANGNGERDAGERQAGADLLAALVSDSDRKVRETAAFALGEIGDPSSVAPLLQLAADADGAVASEAVEALAKLAAHVPLPQYAAYAAADKPEGVRARAIRFLFRFNTDEASGVAAAALDAQSTAIRQEAAYALARRAYPPARERLQLLLTDPNKDVRAYSAAALGRIASKESAGPLLDALRDEHPWVRTNAVVALARVLAKDAAAIERPELAQDALRVIAMSDDPDPGTRSASIEALGFYAARSDVAKKHLAALMTSGSRWNRELAFGAWEKQFGGAQPSTPWEKVRVLEARYRRELTSDPDPMVRATAIGQIADEKADAEADVIRKALDDADVIVRANAIDRYAKLKSPDIAVLRGAEQRGTKDSMNDARLAAINALGGLEWSGREPYLRGLLHDSDPVVRRIAADLIVEKLKKNRPQYTPLPVTRDDYAQIVLWARSQHTATIHMTRGNIEITLVANDAPVTAWNFAQLARKHYFDNTTFMRVVPNFVIQGGDPRNDMNGGPGYAIRDEINPQKYTRGAVGMALSGPDTGGSQFFVTHSPQPHLDGGYTIFGHVYEGMTAVVDQTERGDRVETIGIDERKR